MSREKINQYRTFGRPYTDPLFSKRPHGRYTRPRPNKNNGNVRPLLRQEQRRRVQLDWYAVPLWQILQPTRE